MNAILSGIRILTRAGALVALLGVLFAGAAARAADETPQLALYVMNADGSDLRKLAQAAGQKLHAAPAWSPDGKFVVFHACPKDETPPDHHVFVVKEDGADLKDLGPGAFASWSPDGKQIVFAVVDQNKEKAQAGVWVMNADGKGRQFLFAGTAPGFSPDGSRILFVSAHEGNQFIYVYDVLEGTPKKILQEPYQKRPGNARWSTDGKKVAFVDERNGKTELFVIDAAGSEKGQTMRHRGLIGGPVAWAADARLLLWSKDKATDPQKLSTLTAEGNDSPEALPGQEAGTLNFDPVWSPDGRRVVFVSDRPQS